MTVHQSPSGGRPAGEWKWAHTLEEAVANPVRGQDTSLQDSTLLTTRPPDELERQRAHSLLTQTEKLGPRK